ncbi:hypothetical protein SFIMM107S_02508 [Streptomyces griseus]
MAVLLAQLRGGGRFDHDHPIELESLGTVHGRHHQARGFHGRQVVGETPFRHQPPHSRDIHQPPGRAGGAPQRTPDPRTVSDRRGRSGGEQFQEALLGQRGATGVPQDGADPGRDRSVLQRTLDPVRHAQGEQLLGQHQNLAVVPAENGAGARVAPERLDGRPLLQRAEIGARPQEAGQLPVELLARRVGLGGLRRQPLERVAESECRTCLLGPGPEVGGEVQLDQIVRVGGPQPVEEVVGLRGTGILVGDLEAEDGLGTVPHHREPTVFLEAVQQRLHHVPAVTHQILDLVDHHMGRCALFALLDRAAENGLGRLPDPLVEAQRTPVPVGLFGAQHRVRPGVERLHPDPTCLPGMQRDPLAQLADRRAREAEHQDLAGLQCVVLVPHQGVEPADQRVCLARARTGGDQQPGVPGLLDHGPLFLGQGRAVVVRVGHLALHRCSNCVKASALP